MRPALADLRARWEALWNHPGVRRARAWARLRAQPLLAALLGAGIVAMIAHWW